MKKKSQKNENLDFTFVNTEKHKKKNNMHVFTFMNLENQIKLQVSQILSDRQIVSFHAVWL